MGGGSSAVFLVSADLDGARTAAATVEVFQNSSMERDAWNW
jgi:hypothetical protein